MNCVISINSVLAVLEAFGRSCPVRCSTNRPCGVAGIGCKMPRDRAAYRNVHLYEASTGALIGGFYQNGSITEGNLIWILRNVLLVTQHANTWTIQQRTSGETVTPSSEPARPGDYDIHSTGSFFQNPLLIEIPS